MTHVPPWIGATAIAARAKGGGGGPPVPVWMATTRPPPWVPSAGLTIAGNSWPTGVGANAPGERFTDYLGVKLPALARTNVFVSGMALNIPAAGLNTDPIPNQIIGQGVPGLTNNDQCEDGGLNCYNLGVVPLPSAQFWTTNAANGINGVGGIYPALLGGPAQLNTYYCRTQEETAGPGMKYYPDWVYLMRTQKLLHGPDIFDLNRYLQGFCDPNPATLDYINVHTFRGLPLTYRGLTTAGTSFPATPQTVLNTANTTPNTVAQMTIAAPPGPFAIGSYIQNNNTGALANNLYRKDNAGNWNQLNEKHGSLYNYDQWSYAQYDILAAKDNVGATFAPPGEMYYPQDVAAGVVVGTLYYYGPSPTAMYLFDTAQVLVTEYTLTDNGSVNNRGSITVRRSATGIVTEGYEQLDLQTERNGYYQHAIVDVFVGQPSTQTTPRAWMLPYSVGAYTPPANFSMHGRTDHALADGAQFSFAAWVYLSDITQVPVIYSFNPDNGSLSTLNIGIGNTGRLRITARDAANVLVVNRTAALASALPTNVWVWLVIDIDVSTALDTTTAYFNVAGTPGDTAIVFNAGTAAASTLEASKFGARFFANRAACITFQGYTDAARNQFRGGFGMVSAANGLMGVANPATRAQLWNPLTGAPTPRVPFSAIGTASPCAFDIQGGLGDLGWGGFDPAQPVFGTWANMLLLT